MRTARRAIAIAGVCCGLAAGCFEDRLDPTAVRTFEFGPYTIAPGEEVIEDCVQITLGNSDGPVYVNSVELTTGPGFHHSNWLFVPEHIFPGEDGTFNCDSRGYNEAVAAVFGGVIFAQSTQAPHEVQAFPPGVAVKLPQNTKLVAQLHLLNSTEAPITVRPNLKLTPILEPDVTTTLAGISFQNQALALPPASSSRFTVECELAGKHRELLGRDPDFKIYYALAHYHELGTGLTVEAVKPDGTATEIYSTTNNVGDVLGGPIDPPFDMTGYAGIRFWCEFANPRSEEVRWGIGDQEMCVFLAFSDSTYNWAGGVNEPDRPQNAHQAGDAWHFENACAVFPIDARH